MPWSCPAVRPQRSLSRLLLVLAPLVPPGARCETLTIVTYNVRNYVAVDRQTPEGWRPDYPKPEAEKRALRAVIREANADILFLQEMGPAPYLEELRRDLLREGIDYPYTAIVDGPDPERHVAMLSRIRPVSIRRHDRVPIGFLGRSELSKRGMLEAVFATSAGELTLFGVHLKSRLTEDAADPGSVEQRAAEASAMREILRARFPAPESGRYAVLCDCNDARGSRTLRLLSRRGTLEFLVDLPAADTRGESWTYHRTNSDDYSRVDHVLVSPGLLPSVAGRSALIMDGADTAIASDHRPLVLVLDVGGEPAVGPGVTATPGAR